MNVGRGKKHAINGEREHDILHSSCAMDSGTSGKYKRETSCCIPSSGLE